MKKTFFMLIPIDDENFLGRDHAELIEGRVFDSIESIETEFADMLLKGAVFYSLSDFCTLCNDEEFYPNSYWVTYFEVNDTIKL